MEVGGWDLYIVDIKWLGLFRFIDIGGFKWTQSADSKLIMLELNSRKKLHLTNSRNFFYQFLEVNDVVRVIKVQRLTFSTY